MKKRAIGFLIVAVLFFGVVMNGTQGHACSRHLAGDPHSFSRPWEIAVTHADLELKVVFKSQQILGKARLKLKHLQSADSVVLDIWGMQILGVESHRGDITYRPGFTLTEEDPIRGQGLEIPVPPDADAVTVYYLTSPHAMALQWLEPSQTLGKQKPFLFSQNQPHYARSWIPHQDSPSVRATYTARVETEPGVMALMSARNPQSRSADGSYTFEMNQPIPAYLIALAAGDLEYRPISKRAGVYAEPSQVDAVAWEFADTEKMIQVAERLAGPYLWEQFDVLVLPPGFPYGGMENPRLTFATPTVVAGDRSLVNLVAHELAHSWSGNLATNAVWDDFWLNEGPTVYFERRILEELYGRDVADMHAQLGFRDLEDAIAVRDPRDTTLKLSIGERNPDDVTGIIAYEKGYAFLRLLEERFGRVKFDSFMRFYLKTYEFKSARTEDFLGVLRRVLLNNEPGSERDLRVLEWLYEPGIPANAPRVKSVLLERVERLAQDYFAGKNTLDQIKAHTTGWTTQEWVHFLRQIPQNVTLQQMAEFDGAFQFAGSGNAEIQVEWFKHVARVRYVANFPQIRDFLMRVGRNKFLRAVYRPLASHPDSLVFAREVFAQARANYHPISQRMVEALLNNPDSSTGE